ncbi:hypothetical protein OHS71_28945 [Streptomyces sp. NBC_00377]|nr:MULTISPECIES: hypothetical protein [unclassified Streptomyces]
MEGRDVLEAAGRYQRGRRVADDRQQHLAQGLRVASREVRDGQDRHPGEAHGQAGHPPHAQYLGVPEEAGRQHADDRDARDQQAGGGAGEVPLGIREREPGADDLDDREGQHGLPVGPYRPGQAALP